VFEKTKVVCHTSLFTFAGGVGLQVDVLELLYKEATKYTKEHQRYVGILQDEVKIKSDLVYSKHTGM
jgi:hypothetical protein